jgi:hypothetical protein
MGFRFTLYFLFREARVKNPMICVKKVIKYYVYIVPSKDIFPSLRAQIELKVGYGAFIEAPYSLCSFLLLTYVKVHYLNNLGIMVG